MLPVVAIVGRPNVGKSTLFNYLTRSRDAIVADRPGLTRDRQYGFANRGPHRFIVVDTGGYTDDDDPLARLTAGQALQAEAEADVIVFMVDGKQGPSALDELIGSRLRRQAKPVVLAVNKIDHEDPDVATSEFHRLGIGAPVAMAATRGRGVSKLIEATARHFPSGSPPERELEEAPITLAVVGRPNVGKSTLVNRILGENRVIAHDQPGTTRDSVRVSFRREEKSFLLIDTAGLRRRSRVDEVVEKFSIIKTLQAIDACHVAVVVVDGAIGLTEQDVRLVGLVIDAGRALVLTVNKWDMVPVDDRPHRRDTLRRRMKFASFAPLHFVSALRGWGVGKVLRSVERAFASGQRDLPTPLLTRVLADLVAHHPPPIVRGRRIKLRYAHQGGTHPPVVVVHGNQTARVPDAYRRYLSGAFREALGLYATPVRIEFKTGDNPFRGRTNRLTPRQRRHRQRLMKHAGKRR